MFLNSLLVQSNSFFFLKIFNNNFFFFNLSYKLFLFYFYFIFTNIFKVKKFFFLVFNRDVFKIKITPLNFKKKQILKNNILLKKKNWILPLYINPSYGKVYKHLKKTSNFFFKFKSPRLILENKNNIKSFNLNKFNLKKVFSRFEYRREKMVSIKKKFFVLKKIFLKLFNKGYYFKKKPNIHKIFKNYKKLSYFEFNNMINLSLVNVLKHLLFFCNKFFIFKLIQEGQIYLNNRVIYHNFYILKIGDLIQIVFSKNFLIFFKYWLKKQRFYLQKIKNKLDKRRGLGLINKKKTISRYNPKWFFFIASYYKKIPVWLEIDYFTFSIIIITYPNLYNFNSRYFNPLLYRQLLLK